MENPAEVQEKQENPFDISKTLIHGIFQEDLKITACKKQSQHLQKDEIKGIWTNEKSNCHCVSR